MAYWSVRTIQNLQKCDFRSFQVLSRFGPILPHRVQCAGRFVIAEKPGFEKKNLKKNFDFFSILTGGTLWKSRKNWKNEVRIFFWNPGFSAIIGNSEAPWDGFLVKYGLKSVSVSLVFDRSQSDSIDHWLNVG
jgi:hypothetical protein